MTFRNIYYQSLKCFLRRETIDGLDKHGLQISPKRYVPSMEDKMSVRTFGRATNYGGDGPNIIIGFMLAYMTHMTYVTRH